MPNWKKIIVSGSDASLNSLYVSSSFTASGLIYPTADNGEFSFMQTDGSGNLSLQYVKTMYEQVVNGEATQITKGTPLYISGSQGASPIAYRADAGNPTRMPATYVAGDNIDSAAAGRGIILGLITGVNTTGYTPGTEVFVAVGGGWTAIRPTGSAIVQSLGVVTKEGSGGQGVVLNPGPNSLPNLNSGSVWVGNSSSTPVAVATSSLSVASSVSASYSLVSTSSSFASTASFVQTAQTASYVLNAVSSSYATQALSASFATSASWAPSNLVGGSGSYVARWTSATTLSTGSIFDNGTNVMIGTTTNAGFKLDVNGTARINDSITIPADKFINFGSDYIRTNGARLMTLSATNGISLAGFVGVNTNPVGTAALYVNGSIATVLSKNHSFNGVTIHTNPSLGSRNTAIGNNNGGNFPLDSVGTGTDNIGIGNGALLSLTSASYCISIGNDSGRGITTGAGFGYNISIGQNSMRFSNVGFSIGIGTNTLFNNSSGNQNIIAIGHQAGQNGVGSNSVLLGFQAGLSATGANNLLAGYQAGSNLTTAAKCTYLGAFTGTGFATDNNQVFISDGDGNVRIRITSAGNTLINTTTDAGFRLDVNGTTRLNGNTQITGSLTMLGSVITAGTTNNTYRWNAADGTPTNTDTPTGWVKISLNGVDAWLPYYQ